MRGPAKAAEIRTLGQSNDPQCSCGSRDTHIGELKPAGRRGLETAHSSREMGVLESVLLALALALAIRLALDYLRFRRLEQAIPGPPTLPVVGNLLYGVGLKPDNVLSTVLGLWDNRHDGLWRIGAFGVMVVLVSDPDHLQELLSRKDLVNKDEFLYKFFSAIGLGLANLNGAVWRAHRRAFQPAFHPSLLERFTPVFSAEALGFVRRVRPGEAQGVEDGLQSMVTRAFLRTSVASAELREDDVERILPDIKALVSAVSQSFMYRAAQPWLWPDWVYFYLTAAGRRIRQHTAKVDAFCKAIFTARRAKLSEKRHATASDGEPVISKHRALLEVLMEPGDRLSLSDEEILVELKTLAGAAVDTTVSTLSWALKALSLRHDVQERLLQEVEQVLGKDGTSSDAHITTADLARLQYTECVLKETMRLLPTVPFVGREVRRQTEFCGHTLPAGTTLGLNILGAHRDPRHWPDPLRFDPDRFLPENSVGRHPYAYIPFSAGPRNCIGGRYAMMVMKTLLATLVPRYRIDPVDDGYKEPADLPMAMGIASRMVGGARVVFTPRAGWAGCAA